MEDYYKVLGINQDASQDDVKKAYRKLALHWHPDKNPDNLEEANKKFKEIAEAYEILGNAESRHRYDARRRRGNHSRRGSHHSHSHHRYTNENETDNEYDDGYLDEEDDDALHFFSYNFRSPEEIFNEFFGSHSPFHDVFELALNPFFGNFGFHTTHSSSRRHLNDSEASSSRGGSSNRRSHFHNIFDSWDLLDDPHDHHNHGHHDASSNYDHDNGGTSGGISISGNSGGGPWGNSSTFTSTSTSTKFVDGVKLTTVKKVENGVETTSVYENDVLKNRTVKDRTQTNSRKSLRYKNS